MIIKILTALPEILSSDYSVEETGNLLTSKIININLLEERAQYLRKLLQEGIECSLDVTMQKEGDQSVIEWHYSSDYQDLIPKTETDRDLVLDLTTTQSICEEHKEDLKNIIERLEHQDMLRGKGFETIKEIKECANCEISLSIEFIIQKDRLNSKLKDYFNLPTDIFVKFWLNYENFLSNVKNSLNHVFEQILSLNRKTLFIFASDNLLEKGSDYFKFLCLHPMTEVDNKLRSLLGSFKEDLSEIEKKRRDPISIRADVSYIPPEFFLSQEILAGELPNWLKSVMHIFAYSILSTLCTHIERENDFFDFKILYETEVSAKISFKSSSELEIKNNESSVIALNETTLKNLIDFYKKTLHLKFTPTNLKIIRDAVIRHVGSNLALFFHKIMEIGITYDFRHQNLLSERFEKQTEAIKSISGHKVQVMSRIEGIQDSISQTMTNLILPLFGTILATVLSIVSRVIIEVDITVTLAFLASIFGLFTYIYIPLLHTRSDDLYNMAVGIKKDSDSVLKWIEREWGTRSPSISPNNVSTDIIKTIYDRTTKVLGLTLISFKIALYSLPLFTNASFSSFLMIYFLIILGIDVLYRILAAGSLPIENRYLEILIIIDISLVTVGIITIFQPVFS